MPIPPGGNTTPTTAIEIHPVAAEILKTLVAAIASLKEIRHVFPQLEGYTVATNQQLLDAIKEIIATSIQKEKEQFDAVTEAKIAKAIAETKAADDIKLAAAIQASKDEMAVLQKQVEDLQAGSVPQEVMDQLEILKKAIDDLVVIDPPTPDPEPTPAPEPTPEPAPEPAPEPIPDPTPEPPPA